MKKRRRPRSDKRPPAQHGEIMTLRQVAEYLQCTRATIHRLIRTAKLPGFRLGGSWRFFREDIDAWIKAQQVTPPGQGG